jgi:hypothetical protein
MAKIATLRAMNCHDRLLFLEAVVLLAVARFCVRFVKFRHYSLMLGKQCNNEDSSLQHQGRAKRTEITAIGQEILRAANNVPWEAVCLPQAIVGKWMLKRRGMASELYLGVAKDGSTDFKAHAWLFAGDMPVTGTGIREDFTQIARFC